METIKNWILLRGLARESRHWGTFVDEFAAGLGVDRERIILLDLPGFGSQAQTPVTYAVSDMAEELRAQWISKKGKLDGKWGAMAMSLGAMCLLEWARLFPGDFDALVSINASASDLSKPWQRFSFLQLPRAARIMASKEPTRREAEIYRLTSNGPDAESKGQEWGTFAPPHKDFLKSGIGQLLAAARYVSPKHLDVPMLFLASKADTFVSYKCTEALSQKYGAAMWVHLSAGHDLCLDDPQWVIGKIREWTVGLRNA